MEALQKTIYDMQLEFRTKMDEFQQSLLKANLNPTITALNTEFGGFRKTMVFGLNNLQGQLEMLSLQQDSFEMRSRRKMLLVHGVPESKKEDTSKAVIDVVSEKLEITDITTADVSRSHRLGRVTSGKPRPILIKFQTLAIRDKIWFGKTGLKGSGVTVSEFLTKPRHEAFMSARQQFGVTNCWTRNGSIHINTPDGIRHQICSLAELNRLGGGRSEVSEALVDKAKPAASEAAAGRARRNNKK